MTTQTPPFATQDLTDVPYWLSLAQNWHICIILPTRNEGKNIVRVIDEIKSVFSQHQLKPPSIILADDSSDDTRRIACAQGWYVVMGGGKGLGFAMQQGLRAAASLDPDVILACDADGQSDPQEILDYLKPIAQDTADLVLGSRFLKTNAIGYHYPKINRFGTIVLSSILRKITGLKLTDSHGGLRAMRPEVAQSLEIIGTHTYVQESIIDAHQKGFRITEIPSVWRKRAHGQSRVVSSISRYIMYTLPILIIRSRNHLRWAYGLASLCLTAAVFLFFYIFWQQNFDVTKLFVRLPALLFVSLLALISVQFFTVGFLVEMLGIIKLHVDQMRPPVLFYKRSQAFVEPEDHSYPRLLHTKERTTMVEEDNKPCHFN